MIKRYKEGNLNDSDYIALSYIGNYPASYHKACAYLVSHGGHPPDPNRGRGLIAKALHDLRVIGSPAYVRSVRRGMLFIAGHFPIKSKGVCDDT